MSDKQKESKIVDLYDEKVIKSIALNFVMNVPFPFGKAIDADYVKEIQLLLLQKVKKYIDEFGCMYGRKEAYFTLQVFSSALEKRYANQKLRKCGLAPGEVDTLTEFYMENEALVKQILNRVYGQFRYSNSTLAQYIQKKKDEVGFEISPEWAFAIDACVNVHDVEVLFERIALIQSLPVDTYKLSCVCSNCQANNIKLVIPKGIRAEKYLNDAFCPKCMCQGVSNNMLHTLGSESE